MHPVCSWPADDDAECPQISGLRRCDERTRVNTCINKSLFQALKSSPVILLVSRRQQWSGNWIAWSHTIFRKTHANACKIWYTRSIDIFSVFSDFTICPFTCCSAHRSTFSRENLMRADLSKYIYEQPKIGCNIFACHVYLAMHSNVLLSQNGLKSNFRSSDF